MTGDPDNPHPPAPLLDVWVPGRPVAQGSLKVVGRRGRAARVVDDNPRLAAWRGAVTRLAAAAWRGRTPLAGPVAVELAFVLPLPASAPKSWASRPRWATPHRRRTGDVDKLSRAILDALGAAGVYGDDAQVTHLAAGKAFGPAPGVRVRVRPGEPPPAAGAAPGRVARLQAAAEAAREPAAAPDPVAAGRRPAATPGGVDEPPYTPTICRNSTASSWHLMPSGAASRT